MDKCALRRRRYASHKPPFERMPGLAGVLAKSADSNASLIRREIPGFMEKELVPKVSKNAQLNGGWFTDNEMHKYVASL